MDSTTNSEDLVLTEEWKKNFSTLFRNTPVVALPSGGMSRSATRPQTIHELFSITANIVEVLKLTMNRAESSKEDLWELQADLKAAGRVLKFMTEDQA